MAEEEAVVTGVMTGGVRMGTIGGTQESEVEELMEVVLLEVVQEVARGGVAVVAEEGTNTFRRSPNAAVEEEVQEVGVMDKIGEELQSLQVLEYTQNSMNINNVLICKVAIIKAENALS